MTVETVMEFAGWACLLAFVPGPDILTVITRSVAQGRGAGVVAELGFASGVSVHTTLVAVLMGSASAALPVAAFRAIQYAGAAYLAYLGIRTAMSKEAPLAGAGPGAGAVAARRQLAGIYWQSVLMNVLNPKVTVFFLAFLPGFVAADERGKLWPWILLGAVFAGCTVVCFSTCAAAAAGISGGLRRRPRARVWLKYGTAAVFFGLAVWLLLARESPR